MLSMASVEREQRGLSIEWGGGKWEDLKEAGLRLRKEKELYTHFPTHLSFCLYSVSAELLEQDKAALRILADTDVQPREEEAL